LNPQVHISENAYIFDIKLFNKDTHHGDVNDRRNDIVNDSRIDRLSDSVKTTYLIIKANPGIQRKQISGISGKSIPTVDRHIAVLVKEDFIEHRDSDKTGGYYAKK